VVNLNTGRAGIFCPPDLDLPQDGIIAQGDADVVGWTIAEVDAAAIAAPRILGQVGNFSHWMKQDGRSDVTYNDMNGTGKSRRNVALNLCP
jgi:hypothetical protein